MHVLPALLLAVDLGYGTTAQRAAMAALGLTLTPHKLINFLQHQHYLCFLGQLPRLLQQALLTLHGAHQGAVQSLIQLLRMLSLLTADVANLNEGVNHLSRPAKHTESAVAADHLQERSDKYSKAW